MIVITLLGHLKRFGETFRLDVVTAAEAVRAIESQCSGFRLAIENELSYELIIDDGRDAATPLELAQLTIQRSLVICPVVEGAGAIGRIILGVALVGISFFMPAAFLGLSSTTIGLFGASLIIGGITQLLSPQQKETFNGTNADASNGNRAVQGQPVPILFGQRFINPPPISTWVTNNNVSVSFNPFPQ